VPDPLNAPPTAEPSPPVDRLSWAEIRRLALHHRKSLWIANIVAALAVLCSVPIPLLLPLLVDEVLLGHGDRALTFMNQFLPDSLHKAAGYIGLMLLFTLTLRLGALVFNVLQARLFARLAKDIVYRIRLRLIDRLKRISLGEYESLGSGTVTAHLVTDLDTVDKFVGETLSKFLVAVLTLAGTSAILLWMHWQLALLILLFNPLVIFATVQLGKRVKTLKKLENDSTSRFTQALTETLDAIQEVRAGNRQGYFLGRLGLRAQEVRDYAVASQWKSDASNRASGLLFQFGIDIFRAAAMLTVLFSDLSIGHMLAVFSYLWFMIGPVEQLLNLQYAFYAAGGALTRINELLSRADEPQYPGGTDPFAGQKTVGIEVRGLQFGYGDEPVLDQLNLSIAPGEKVAIVGAAAAGFVHRRSRQHSLRRRYAAGHRSGNRAGKCRGGLAASCAVQRHGPRQPDHGPRAGRRRLLAGASHRSAGRDHSPIAARPGQRGRTFGRAFVRRSAPTAGHRAHGVVRPESGDPRRGHVRAGRCYRIQPASGPGAVSQRAHDPDRCAPPVRGKASRSRAGV
jgi:ATP-binding cassette subfamily C protein